MPRKLIVALITVYLVAAPLPIWAGDEAFHFPHDGEGYTITKTDTHEMAPEGFEGATDTATKTAIGNSPSTQGTRIDMRFTTGNLIPACPDADGKVAGEGFINFSTDATYANGPPPATSMSPSRRNTKARLVMTLASRIPSTPTSTTPGSSRAHSVYRTVPPPARQQNRPAAPHHPHPGHGHKRPDAQVCRLSGRRPVRS